MMTISSYWKVQKKITPPFKKQRSRGSRELQQVKCRIEKFLQEIDKIDLGLLHHIILALEDNFLENEPLLCFEIL
jgi:hypothetical protein